MLLTATAEFVFDIFEMVDQDDASNAPLIQGQDPIDFPQDESSDYDVVTRPREKELTAPSAFIWALTVTAGISGLLFGYEFVMTFLYSLQYR